MVSEADIYEMFNRPRHIADLDAVLSLHRELVSAEEVIAVLVDDEECKVCRAPLRDRGHEEDCAGWEIITAIRTLIGGPHKTIAPSPVTVAELVEALERSLAYVSGYCDHIDRIEEHPPLVKARALIARARDGK